MKSFVVIGNPIRHSKSPTIHQAFAQQFSIKLNYQQLLADVGCFDEAITRFFITGYGANITVPFKEEALHYADILSECAQLAGAVNTLSKKEGKIYGDNTDGIGLVRDITHNQKTAIAGKKVLLIGAGGASRGVIQPILQANPKQLIITNRTLNKAEQLAHTFSTYGNISAQAINEIKHPFDIIINATSASLAGEQLPINPGVFNSDSVAYDMMYGKSPSPFLQLATTNQAKAIDGLGMLVEQAAESFTIWHQQRPNTQPVLTLLRASL